MSRRRIGQERFGFAGDGGKQSSLDELTKLIDWMPIDRSLEIISCAAKGEPAWPPLSLFKAMLLSIWYDLSDVKPKRWTIALLSDGSAGSRCRSQPRSEPPLFAFGRRSLRTDWTRSCSIRSPVSSRQRRSE